MPAEPLRVLFLAHAFPRHDGDPAGGFVLRLAAALAELDVQVGVLAPAAPGLAGQERLAGVPVRRYRYAPRWAETLAYGGQMHRRAASPAGAAALAGLLGAGALAARRAAARADLVHAHWWFPGGLQAVLGRTRRPLVTTLHGTDVRLAAGRRLARAGFARVLRRSAAVTAVSSWLAGQAVVAAPELAGRVRVAPMPADDTVFSPGELPRQELLFVGRLDGQKDAAVALRALAELRGPAARLPLRIVGSGPERVALGRLAGDLAVADRVRWEPGLPQAELADRYRRAAALLVPGRDEGLGLVAVEAQLCGAPVVAAASGGLLDVVADRATGRTFPPGQPAALARVVEQLVADPAASARLAAAGRAAAVARFAPRAAAEAYAAVYHQTLKR
ncbi:MAG TPA: glycosyltransferase family 4 protein [Actinomycetes bacterium]|jgi:glycosyltransferase involved in cell wall biosynthesis|nr:glycosyltransferase family 4 protein [Actinomycetes bacterium]